MIEITSILGVAADFVACGVFGIVWWDIRTIKRDMGKYVKSDDCSEKRGMCGSMREAVVDIVQNHQESLTSMQDLLRKQAECLARLDEKLKSLKERWEDMTNGARLPEGDALYRHRRSSDVQG